MKNLFTEGFYFVIEIGAVDREANFEHSEYALSLDAWTISKFPSIAPTKLAIEFTIYS